MLNPFRNLLPGIHPLMSASVYSTSTPVRKTPSRNKGFFHRLIHLGRVLHFPLEASYRTVEIDAKPIQRNKTSSVDSTANSSAVLPDVADNVPSSNPDSINSDCPTHNSTPEHPPDYPNYSATLLQEAHFCLQQGDLTAAITHYRRAIELAPTLLEAYEYLAEALTRQGDLEAAAGCYRQAIALSQGVESVERSSANHRPAPRRQPLPRRVTNTKPQSSWFEQAGFHLQQATVICNAGDWQEAQAACQNAIRLLEPEAAHAYLILGRSLQGQKQFAAAEQAYQKSLTLVSSAEGCARLGSLYVEQQQFSDAAAYYQAAVQRDANFAGAYWKLAEVWQHLDQEAQAVACWQRAFQLQPSWATMTRYCQLGDRLLRLEQLEAAQHCYEQALQRQPNCCEAHAGIGAVLARQGQFTAAIERYRQAIAQNSQNPDFYAQIGAALADLAQWEDARLCYQRLLDSDNQRIDAVKGLYHCLTQLEQWQDALIYSRQLVEHQPDSAQDWQNLGDVLSRLSQWTEAVIAYEQVIRLDPGFAWAYNNLGDAFLQLEQWQRAATAFQTAISLNPDFVWSHYNLGTAWRQLQEWDRAIAAYQTALDLQPDLPYAFRDLADALQQRAAIDQSNALTYYRQAIQQNPLDPEHYHKAIELQPDAVDLYLGLVDALLSQNRIDEALVCGQLARQLQPDSEEIIAKLKALQQQKVVQRPQTAADVAIDYARWMEQNTPTVEQLQQMAEAALSLPYQPLISVLMPVYNPPEPFLRAALESVLKQVYLRWELCIADDASDASTQAILNEYASRDPRIKIVFRPENGQVSAASNSALALATGAFIALLDQDDVLAPEALYEVVSLLNQHPDADMIYSDEDKLDQQGQRIQPFFKPNWCPDSFLSRMYTCHLGVYRRRLVNQLGGFRLGYEGSQDYDLVLRLSEQTERIFHIPKVLYHWRRHDDSTASNHAIKSHAATAAKQALTEACQRRQQPLREITTHADFPGVYLLRYQITDPKLVSIVIPTRNLGDVLDRCLNSLFLKTTYPNYEVILIDNGSDEIETFNIIAKWEQQESERLRCYSLDIPFNYSKINNLAITEANGDYLLFLNNDVEIIAPDWIEAMVEQAQRDAIGAVGGQLLYPDNTVQHAGVVLGIGGVAGHSHKHFPVNHPGYFSQIVSINNYSAVTGACLMCRRTVFEQVGGFDETLAVAFNDVDLCLKIRQAGYRNVYLPHVQLYHHESLSRGSEDSWEKQQRFKQELETVQQRWGEWLSTDPCYNPNLSLDQENYRIRF